MLANYIISRTAQAEARKQPRSAAIAAGIAQRLFLIPAAPK